MKRWTRPVLGVLLGCVAVVALFSLAAVVIRATWPEYVAVAPTRAFTLPMLWCRLGIGALCTMAGGATATWVARDRGGAAWGFGALALVISLPPHLGSLWEVFPVWYHFVYLGYLLPLSVGAGWLVRRRPGQTPQPHGVLAA